MRKSELLHARWENVDFDKAEWLIPEGNSKTGKPHTVYMSRQVCELFRELKVLAGDSELVLPERSSLKKPFAANALNKALKGVNFSIEPFTIHDLRRTGSTLLHEQGFPTDVIEKALNHSIGGVRGVYNRAEYAEQRRQMLQAWADYVDMRNQLLRLDIMQKLPGYPTTGSTPINVTEAQAGAFGHRERITDSPECCTRAS